MNYKQAPSMPAMLAALSMTLAAAMLSGCATMLLPPNISPVVTTSRSVADADAKLAAAVKERASVEAEFAASEQVCYSKFFVNNCLDKAKEKRRSALVALSAIEVEAEYFKRKAGVDERDREVEKAVRQFEASEVARAAAPEPAPREVAEPMPKAPKASLAARRSERESKAARRAAMEQAEAPRRAASVKEFEERRIASEQRQKRVADKLAQNKAKAEAAAKAAVPAGQ